MKKLIISLSMSLSVVFAYALANATESGQSGSDQSAGEVSESMKEEGSKMGEEAGSATEEAGEQAKSAWETAKSCTTADGTTYAKGESGFDACIKEKMKEEQAGQVQKSESSNGSGY